MNTSDRVFETLKELMSASNPGLVTKDELLALERRVDELLELVEALESRLERLPEQKSS